VAEIVQSDGEVVAIPDLTKQRGRLAEIRLRIIGLAAVHRGRAESHQIFRHSLAITDLTTDSKALLAQLDRSERIALVLCRLSQMPKDPGNRLLVPERPH